MADDETAGAAPASFAAALAEQERIDAAFIAAVEAEIAAQRKGTTVAAQTVQDLEDAVDAILRRRWGAWPWVRAVGLAKLSSVDPKTHLAYADLPAGAGGGASTPTLVRWGQGSVQKNRRYAVFSPVTLPPAGTPLKAGPIAAGLPWIHGGGGRALFQKRKYETTLRRWDWPPPGQGQSWEATVLQTGLPPKTILFGAATARDGSRELVLMEQVDDDAPPGPAPQGSFRTRLTHYAEMGAGKLTKSWLPNERYLQIAAISSEGQATTGTDYDWGPVPGLPPPQPGFFRVMQANATRFWRGTLGPLGVINSIPQFWHWGKASGLQANEGWSVTTGNRWMYETQDTTGVWGPDDAPAVGVIYEQQHFVRDPVPLVADVPPGTPYRRPYARYGSAGDTLPDDLKYIVQGFGCNPAAPTDLRIPVSGVDLQMAYGPQAGLTVHYLRLDDAKNLIVWAHSGTGFPPGSRMDWSIWRANATSWRPVAQIQWVAALSRDGQEALALYQGGQWVLTQDGGDKWAPCATPAPALSPSQGAYPNDDSALLLDV